MVPNGGNLKILKGGSVSPDPKIAAKELYQKIFQPDISFAMFFCAAEYDREALGRELSRLFWRDESHRLYNRWRNHAGRLPE